MSETLIREAFFLSDAGQHLFCIHRKPATASRGAVLLVPPFAEELNRSRRMLAVASERFAEAGWETLQLDLMGCGDSDGSFEDATWDAWLSNLQQAFERLSGSARGPVVLWGLRAGCLLICDWLRASQRDTGIAGVLFWQPVASGRQHLTHFLRLKALSESAEPEHGSVVKAARARLQMGGYVDVAGYRIGSQLATGLEHADLELSEAFRGRVGLVEVSAKRQEELSPVIGNHAVRWRSRGLAVDTHLVQGPAFWLTQEITQAPLMIDASVAYLDTLCQ